MSRLRCLCGIIATLMLGACAVGPDYDRPDFGDDAQWRDDASESPTQEVRLDWWRSFDDPQLTALVERAVAGNRDLQGALARINEARAGSAAARGARLPAVAADLRYTWFEQSLESPANASALIRSGLIPREGEFYNATLESSWELDLFGNLSRRVERADADAALAAANFDAVQLQVIAETVDAYSDWQSFARRLMVAERNVALQQRTLDIIEGKVRLGLARRLDEVRAASALAELRAQLPTLAAAKDGARERLAVLLGTVSQAIELTVNTTAGEMPASVAVGTKADLLRRRPDVRLAEAALIGAVADQGIASAAFFPSLTLTASGGFEAGDVGALLSGDARSIGIVPFVRWPLFQGGRLRAALAAADAREQQAMASYEQSVLRAFADTETALSAFAAARLSVVELAKAATLAAEAESLANKLYGQGLSDYLTLLVAQRQLAIVDDALIVAENRVMLSTTRLYKSLGGGWATGQD